MNQEPKEEPAADERDAADAVEEIVEQEPPTGAETPDVDAAEEVAEREAEDYEEQDAKSGDDPPAI